MNKYVLLIGILLILIFLSIVYVIFTDPLQGDDNVNKSRRDVTIIFSKESKSFVPQEITVTEGDTVYVKFINEDLYPHGLAIDTFGVASDASAQSTIFVHPFIATKTGHFVFYCSIPGESHLSEMGTLVVEPFNK